MFQKLKAKFTKSAPTCEHVFFHAKVTGGTNPPKPHPHPAFTKDYNVVLRDMATVSVCFKCKTVKAAFGYDEIMAEKIDHSKTENAGAN